jgi:arsenate reductase-like glutaredoxin family protein
MDLFKSKSSQALQTAMNRARMYDQSRKSEVNTDGVISKSEDSYNSLNKKNQWGTKGSVKQTEVKPIN